MSGATNRDHYAFESDPSSRKSPTTERSNWASGSRGPAASGLAKALAGEVVSLLKPELARLSIAVVQPVLLDVKQAAVYLGRSEQSVQHLIFEKDLPVVRKGRRVHLHRSDLDIWIEKNKY
jgi:excisionase family DNA binding protein